MARKAGCNILNCVVCKIVDDIYTYVHVLGICLCFLSDMYNLNTLRSTGGVHFQMQICVCV